MDEKYLFRNDMRLPCNAGCPRRFVGCRETCDDPEFLKAMELRRLAEEDRQRRKTEASIDRRGRARRALVEATKNKGRGGK